MELDDCAFPLLQEIVPTSDLNEGFKGTDWALLVGSVPRKAGMERADLLGINGKIFTGQGQAIAANANSDVKTLVVGNPCNTNCLIAMNNADGISNRNFFAMTRLDENRAKSQLAAKAGVHSSAISNMCIWGNHSATQYPDFTNAKINGQPAADVITDSEWLKGEFISTRATTRRGHHPGSRCFFRGFRRKWRGRYRAFADQSDARWRLDERVCLLRWLLRNPRGPHCLHADPLDRLRLGSGAGSRAG